MTQRIRTRFLVIGSGVAGLHAAWRASAHGPVTVLTKRTLFDSATAYAQGGIAAALGAGDSPDLHRQDTLAAGAALCDAAAVQVLEGRVQCAGVRASIAGRAVEIVADATVLATGGCGQIFRYTTNPQVATGDGFAIAHRAGARLAELAPRDVVAREIFREQQQYGTVFLDATKLGAEFATRFPGILAICRARGIDPVHEPIPVTPAAHYMMGGVMTDLAGRSSIARLYAVGEVARTGVHGANRLASNSLLEGLVFAGRVARDMVETPTDLPVPEPTSWEVPALEDRGAAQVAADEIRELMWPYASIARTAPGLRRCLAALHQIGARLAPGATEERNPHTTATLVTEASLLRKESRGGHFRSDFPKTRRKWQGKHITW